MAKSATPQSLVYRGMEGSGAAQVFGTEGNPLRPLMWLSQNLARQKALDDERKRQVKAERDKRLVEVISADPEKTFAPFNEEVINKAQQHRAKVTQYAENNGDINSPAFVQWNKKGWDDINDYARRGLHIQETIKNVEDKLKSNPYTAGNINFYRQKMLDIYMDPEGSNKAIPLDKVDVKKLESVIEDNPEGYDLQKFTRDYMKDMKENVFNYTKQRLTNYGLETSDLDVKIKGELFTPDENTKSGVREDAEGNPIINVTPYFMNSFLSNGNTRLAVEKMAKEQGITTQQAIESLVRPEGGHSLDTDTKGYRDPEWYYNMTRGNQWGIGVNDIQGATQRWSKIKSIVNAYDQDGNVTSDARAALGEIKKNLKISGADVMDATFVEGTNQPGSSKILGMTVMNQPFDRVVFSTIRSGSKIPKPIEFNLDDEGSMAELNGMFEQAKAEGGRHYSVDQLQGFHGEKWNDIKKGREGRVAAKEAIKAAENGQVSKWQEGEDLESLTGRIHNGKVIKNVKMGEVSTGIMPWSNEPVLDILYEDGSADNVPASDYESIAKIYRGESKGSTAPEGKVMVQLPNGQKGYISADKLEEALKRGAKQIE